MPRVRRSPPLLDVDRVSLRHLKGALNIDLAERGETRLYLSRIPAVQGHSIGGMPCFPGTPRSVVGADAFNAAPLRFLGQRRRGGQPGCRTGTRTEPQL